LLGALALHIEGQQGWLHSETYHKPEYEGEVRQRLWERAQAVARNYGLYRVWIDAQAPFWKSQGFQPAPPELQKKMPPRLNESGRSWLVLPLREEVTTNVAVEREFELFARAQREKNDRMVRQAQALKNIAYALLIGVAALGLILIVFLVLPGANRARLGRPRAPAPAANPTAPTQTSTNNGSAPANNPIAPPDQP
jgi:hypothetical protein